jgi:colanic acid/amylovoran biosynthesis glycosyltransferase
MRIAFIVPEFPSLSQTFVLNQITGLMDLGHDIEIFAYRGVNDAKIHHDVFKYRLLERTQYYGDAHLGIPKNRLLRILKGIALSAKSIWIKPTTVLNSLNIIKQRRQALTFRLLFRMMPFMQKDPYDIIHCHFGPVGNHILRLKEMGAITGKLITTFHGYDISTYLEDKDARIYEDLFSEGDLFLPISRRWKQKLIELGCKEDKIKVHRMGVDLSKFQLCTRSISKNKTVNILTVARLVEKKGIEYGIMAVAKLLKNYPDVVYRIAGDGPLREELEDLIHHLKVDENVHLLGPAEQHEIVDLMINSDILLAPSVTAKDGDQEGIPVVLMEAFATGLPIISTYHSGIPELVQDGISGFLVSERDIEGLCEKLIDLISKSELRLEMGLAGRKCVEAEYDIVKLNDSLAKTYEWLLA